MKKGFVIKMNEIKVNPLTLADMLAAEGKTLAQAKLINKSELQLYKEGIRLIGKAFPAFGMFAQESLEIFSEDDQKKNRLEMYHRPEADTHTLMYNLIAMMIEFPENDRQTISQLIQVAARFS